MNWKLFRILHPKKVSPKRKLLQSLLNSIMLEQSNLQQEDSMPPRRKAPPIKFICVFDFETGGLSPWSKKQPAEPLELAAVLLDKETLQEVDRFGPRRMRVRFPENLSKEALTVNGRLVEEIMQCEDPEDVFADFAMWLLGHTRLQCRALPAGHNVPFDIQFMRWAFENYLDGDVDYEQLFDYHFLCTAILVYWQKVLIEKSLPYNKLTLITPYYGIDHDAAHTAMSDVKATADLLRAMWDEYDTSAKLLAFMRQNPQFANQVLLAMADPTVERVVRTKREYTGPRPRS